MTDSEPFFDCVRYVSSALNDYSENTNRTAGTELLHLPLCHRAQSAQRAVFEKHYWRSE